MDNGNNARKDGLDVAIKTILIMILIFGLLIGCIYLYLWSFVNRVRKMEAARETTVETVETQDAYDQQRDKVLFGS